MTQTLTPPTAVLLLEYGQQDANWERNFQDLAARLARQLNQTVIPCFLDCSTNPVLDGIRRGVQQGAVKFVVLPLFLSPAMYRDNAIAEAVTWASRRWPFLTFHVSQSLNWETWTNIFRTQLNEAELLTDTSSFPRRAEPTARSDLGLVLIGQGGEPSGFEDSNEGRGDLAKLGRLIFEAIDVKWVELGFLAQAYPDVDRAIQQTLTAGAKLLILQPAFLFRAMSLDPIIQRRLTDDEVQFQVLPPSDQGTALLNALVDQYFVTLEDDRLLPLRWDEVRREVEANNASHQPVRTGIVLDSDEGQLQDLTARINAILPPRYQNQKAVSAAPMAAAELQFDTDGAVAWDKMWGLDDPDNPFCELALAGGPPHRGDLLEPALAEVCLAEPEKYAAVLAELTRGINLVAGLSTVKSHVPGWIGVQCTNEPTGSPEAMAIWLLRAIIVENVMVRRENTILYLPAGPHFTLTGEIKTVVTVVAKTVHYWHEHRLK